MPVQKRAINPSRFSELTDLFPCPAWIEDFSGRILVRNAHLRARAIRAAENRRSLKPQKTVAYPLPLAGTGNMKKLRLVAHFPVGQEADCQGRVITALLARMLQTPQAAATAETLLTPCERETYCELARGYSYKTIAEHLGVSHEAVRQRIVQMRRKLGASQIPLLRHQA